MNLAARYFSSPCLPRIARINLPTRARAHPDRPSGKECVRTISRVIPSAKCQVCIVRRGVANAHVAIGVLAV